MYAKMSSDEILGLTVRCFPNRIDINTGTQNGGTLQGIAWHPVYWNILYLTVLGMTEYQVIPQLE